MTKKYMGQKTDEAVAESSRAYLLGLARRIIEKSHRHMNGCIVWDGAVAGKYGVICCQGSNVTVHRAVYVMKHGPQPGKEIDHTCENKLCIKLSHLQAVRPKTNQRRWMKNQEKVADWKAKMRATWLRNELKRREWKGAEKAALRAEIRASKFHY